jgi:tetratricopeptide (TPR) repeat protein
VDQWTANHPWQPTSPTGSYRKPVAGSWDNQRLLALFSPPCPENHRGIKVFGLSGAGERWYCRGIVHWRGGRHDRALADLRNAVELGPERATFCHARARLYALALEPPRDAAQALALAERAVQRRPGDWLLEHTRGVALYRAGRTGEALPVLERSLKGGGGQLDALNLYFLALCRHRPLTHRSKIFKIQTRARRRPVSVVPPSAS